MKKSNHESISEVYFGYTTILEVYTQLTADINELCESPVIMRLLQDER